MLNDNDCLQYVILVGSWCEFLYRETKILGNFTPNIKTLDMDFLIILGWGIPRRLRRSAHMV